MQSWGDLGLLHLYGCEAPVSVAENGCSAFQRAKISSHATQGNTPQGPVLFFLKELGPKVRAWIILRSLKLKKNMVQAPLLHTVSCIFLPKIKLNSWKHYTWSIELYAHAYLRTLTCRYAPVKHIIIIIWFLINLQVPGHHSLQWAPFQVTG